MKVNVLYVGLAAVAIVLVSIVICRPAWVSDNNQFLREFVGYGYLNVLGVIFAISLASLAQVHLSLNRIEQQRQEKYFSETRREIKEAAYLLIGLFGLAVVIVIAKPLACTTQTETAIANSLSIFVLVTYVLILLDIITAVFSLEPDMKDDWHSKVD